ncbi:MAG: hypothetical protein ABUK15_06350, partial [Anaerolineales bacterium]
MFDPGGVGEWSLDKLGMISPHSPPLGDLGGKHKVNPKDFNDEDGKSVISFFLLPPFAPQWGAAGDHFIVPAPPSE